MSCNIFIPCVNTSPCNSQKMTMADVSSKFVCHCAYKHMVHCSLSSTVKTNAVLLYIKIDFSSLDKLCIHAL